MFVVRLWCSDVPFCGHVWCSVLSVGVLVFVVGGVVIFGVRVWWSGVRVLVFMFGVRCSCVSVCVSCSYSVFVFGVLMFVFGVQVWCSVFGVRMLVVVCVVRARCSCLVFW